MRIAYLQFDENEARKRLNKKELMKLWNQLLLMSSGDVQQALEWLKQLAQKYGIGDEEWFQDFVASLQNEGFIEPNELGIFVPTKKAERAIRKDSLDQVFRNLEGLGSGEHRTSKTGTSLERQPETRPFNFGDLSSDIDYKISITNALKRGIDEAPAHHQPGHAFAYSPVARGRLGPVALDVAAHLRSIVEHKMMQHILVQHHHARHALHGPPDREMSRTIAHVVDDRIVRPAPVVALEPAERAHVHVAHQRGVRRAQVVVGIRHDLGVLCQEGQQLFAIIGDTRRCGVERAGVGDPFHRSYQCCVMRVEHPNS